MRERILSSYDIQSDDTHVTMMDKNAKNGSRKSYLWVYLGDEGEAVFDFTRVAFLGARSGEGPEKFLKGYQGYLQADAYSGYDRMFKNTEMIEVACWAHARRKFFDAKEWHETECAEMLTMIGALYQIEREAKERKLTFDEREKLRLDESIPILDKIKRRLDFKENKILPKSPFHEAIQYCKNQWTALTPRGWKEAREKT